MAMSSAEELVRRVARHIGYHNVTTTAGRRTTQDGQDDDDDDDDEQDHHSVVSLLDQFCINLKNHNIREEWQLALLTSEEFKELNCPTIGLAVSIRAFCHCRWDMNGGVGRLANRREPEQILPLRWPRGPRALAPAPSHAEEQQQPAQASEGTGSPSAAAEAAGGGDDESSEASQPVLKLSRFPKTLYVLWEEYEFGIDGSKPAKYYDAKDRGNKHVKDRYVRRKVVWDCIQRQIDKGMSSDVAIERIYAVYGGTKVGVTAIINQMRIDRRNKTFHPDLL